MADELIITLKTPIKVGTLELTELKLREPTAGELVDSWSTNPYAWTLALASAVSGVPLKLVRGISIDEMRIADAYLAGFISGGRADTPS